MQEFIIFAGFEAVEDIGLYAEPDLRPGTFNYKSVNCIGDRKIKGADSIDVKVAVKFLDASVSIYCCIDEYRKWFMGFPAGIIQAAFVSQPFGVGERSSCHAESKPSGINAKNHMTWVVVVVVFLIKGR